MKKIIIALSFLITLICAGTGKHDFHYYKQKTIELLPALGIKEADVTFAVTHKEVLIEQRHKKPKTIFLNIEKLSKISHNAALFECALQAQLTTLNWDNILIKPQPLSEKYLILPSLPGGYYNGDAAVIIAIIYLTLLIGKGFLMAYDYSFPPQAKPSEEKFKYESTTKIIDIMYALLLKDHSAQLAYIGFEQHHKQLPTIKDQIPTLYTKYFSKEGILLKFREWITKHPDAWQEIKKELKPETITLIQNKPVEDKNQGKS